MKKVISGSPFRKILEEPMKIGWILLYFLLFNGFGFWWVGHYYFLWVLFSIPLATWAGFSVHEALSGYYSVKFEELAPHLKSVKNQN